jgi:tetratricopeptide (TPR) repeat protein
MLVIGELEREAEGLVDVDKAERYHEIGLLCEEVVPDRDRALDYYQRAWKLAPSSLKSAARMRAVFREMGRLEQLVKFGEQELAAEKHSGRRAEIAAQVGTALLDMGHKERAADLLAEAVEELPDALVIRDALAAANYDSEDWISEVEKLSSGAERADSGTAARMCLRAARILHIEMPEDKAYEEMLRRSASRTVSAAPCSSPRRSRPRTKMAPTSCTRRWQRSRCCARSSARARSGESSSR